MTATLLHSCPPLRAFISLAQCTFNRGLAARSLAARPGSDTFIRGMVVRETCPTCPGVLKLNAGTRELPEVQVVCHPRRRRRVEPLTGIAKRIGITAARYAAQWTCPAHLTTVSALSGLLHLAPQTVRNRLARAKVRPVEHAAPLLGRPTLYARAEAEEACQ